MLDNRKKNIVVCTLIGVWFFFGWIGCIFFPKQNVIASERRKAALLPSLTWQSVWDGRFMKGFQAFATDTFPFREQLRSIKANSVFALFHRSDYNGLYETDGYIAKMDYPIDEESLTRATNRFRYIYDKYANETNHGYVSVIFDKNVLLADDSGHLAIDAEALEKFIKSKTAFATYISIRDLLQKEDFYQTDTHWRQEKIIDVANHLLSMMNTDLNTDYEKYTLERPFYGVYHGQFAHNYPSERMHYLRNDVIDHCLVYDWQNEKEISVYDMEKAQGNDPYEMFLSGNLSLVTLKNNNANAHKKLILFRDSFGSSIAPLLLAGYGEITLVDIRLIHPDQLGNFLDFEGCDILFLYSTLVLNHSETLK